MKFDDDVEDRNIELFSQQVLISSTPNGGLDLERFSLIQDGNNIDSIPQSLQQVTTIETNKKSTRESTSKQKRLMDNLFNDDQYDFIFNNCSVKINFNETSSDNQ